MGTCCDQLRSDSSLEPPKWLWQSFWAPAVKQPGEDYKQLTGQAGQHATPSSFKVPLELSTHTSHVWEPHWIRGYLKNRLAPGALASNEDWISPRSRSAFRVLRTVCSTGPGSLTCECLYQKRTVRLRTKKQEKLAFSDRTFSKAAVGVMRFKSVVPAPSCAQLKATEDTLM